jgi:hypothetical protein
MAAGDRNSAGNFDQFAKEHSHDNSFGRRLDHPFGLSCRHGGRRREELLQPTLYQLGTLPSERRSVRRLSERKLSRQPEERRLHVPEVAVP